MKSQSHQHLQSPTPPRSQEPQILVVEDHPDSRRSLELFLKILGYQAQFARGVQDALAIAAAHGKGFDLLLSDLRLPDGDGWELLRCLEEKGWRPQRAIALSGWGSNEDLAKSRAAGFHAHLIKPFSPDAIAAALREVVESLQSPVPRIE
jgi:CheY-like chemotaxis protein